MDDLIQEQDNIESGGHSNAFLTVSVRSSSFTQFPHQSLEFQVSPQLSIVEFKKQVRHGATNIY